MSDAVTSTGPPPAMITGGGTSVTTPNNNPGAQTLSIGILAVIAICVVGGIVGLIVLCWWGCNHLIGYIKDRNEPPGNVETGSGIFEAADLARARQQHKVMQAQQEAAAIEARNKTNAFQLLPPQKSRGGGDKRKVYRPAGENGLVSIEGIGMVAGDRDTVDPDAFNHPEASKWFKSNGWALLPNLQVQPAADDDDKESIAAPPRLAYNEMSIAALERFGLNIPPEKMPRGVTMKAPTPGSQLLEREEVNNSLSRNRTMGAMRGGPMGATRGAGPSRFREDVELGAMNKKLADVDNSNPPIVQTQQNAIPIPPRRNGSGDSPSFGAGAVVSPPPRTGSGSSSIAPTTDYSMTAPLLASQSPTPVLSPQTPIPPPRAHNPLPVAIVTAPGSALPIPLSSTPSPSQSPVLPPLQNLQQYSYLSEPPEDAATSASRKSRWSIASSRITVSESWNTPRDYSDSNKKIVQSSRLKKLEQERELRERQELMRKAMEDEHNAVTVAEAQKAGGADPSEDDDITVSGLIGISVSSYVAQNELEVDLSPGHSVVVFEAFEDGFGYGVNKNTATAGLFPLNIITFAMTQESPDGIYTPVNLWEVVHWKLVRDIVKIN